MHWDRQPRVPPTSAAPGATGGVPSTSAAPGGQPSQVIGISFAAGAACPIGSLGRSAMHWDQCIEQVVPRGR